MDAIMGCPCDGSNEGGPSLNSYKSTTMRHTSPRWRARSCSPTRRPTATTWRRISRQRSPGYVDDERPCDRAALMACAG
jgi:hypothetical protein